MMPTKNAGNTLTAVGADAAVFGAVAEQAGFGHLPGINHACGEKNIGGVGRVREGEIDGGVRFVACSQLV